MSKIFDLARESVRCNKCFNPGELVRAGIGMPQPPWIGSEYFKQRTRILLLGINPGGKTSGDYKLERKHLLRRFEKGDDSALLEYFSSQKMIGNAKFLDFLNSIGLRLPNVAVGNIALCATEGNNYPRSFLRTCFSTFTIRWLKELDPVGVITMGSEVHRFKEEITKALLPVRITQFSALHFSPALFRTSERAKTGAQSEFGCKICPVEFYLEVRQ